MNRPTTVGGFSGCGALVFHPVGGDPRGGVDRGTETPAFQRQRVRDVEVLGAGVLVGQAGVGKVAEGNADAVLAASIFHRDIHSISAVKADMAAAGVPVRLTEEAS